MVIRSPAQLRALLQRAALPTLVLLAAIIIVLGKAAPGVVEALRTGVADDAAPLLGALSRPLDAAAALVDRARGIVEMYRDNRRLEEDNARLLQWQQVAFKLSAENRELRGLLKAVPEHAVSYVTARVIAASGGGYVRSVLIDAGSEEGLARGQAAVTGDGLVGRLTEVGNRAARVLLITDLNARIPVIVMGGARVNALLAGDNSERPRLIYAADAERIKIGQRVVTSGDGGVFPPGLAVGVVSAVDPGGGAARVTPYVELSQLGYLLIVDYGLAHGLPQPAPAPAPAATAAATSARHERRGQLPAADEADVR